MGWLSSSRAMSVRVRMSTAASVACLTGISPTATYLLVDTVAPIGGGGRRRAGGAREVSGSECRRPALLGRPLVSAAALAHMGRFDVLHGHSTESWNCDRVAAPRPGSSSIHQCPSPSSTATSAPHRLAVRRASTSPPT